MTTGRLGSLVLCPVEPRCVNCGSEARALPQPEVCPAARRKPFRRKRGSDRGARQEQLAADSFGDNVDGDSDVQNGVVVVVDWLDRKLDFAWRKKEAGN